MSKEYYSILIQPNSVTIDEINTRLSAINRRIDFPHITLGRPFHSNLKNIRSGIKNSLGMYDPFDIHLDTIGSFRDRTLFLTTSIGDEIDRVKDLFYITKKMIDGGMQENIGFLPHMTLLREFPSEFNQTRKTLETIFNEPILMPITRIDFFRAGNLEWEKLEQIELRQTEKK